MAGKETKFSFLPVPFVPSLKVSFQKYSSNVIWETEHLKNFKNSMKHLTHQLLCLHRCVTSPSRRECEGLTANCPAAAAGDQRSSS